MRIFLHSAASTINVSLCFGRIKTLLHSPLRTSASLPQMYGRKSVPTQNLYFFQQELAESLFEPRPVSNSGFQNHDTRPTLPIATISELPKPNHHDGNLVEHRKMGRTLHALPGQPHNIGSFPHTQCINVFLRLSMGVWKLNQKLHLGLNIFSRNFRSFLYFYFYFVLFYTGKHVTHNDTEKHNIAISSKLKKMGED